MLLQGDCTEHLAKLESNSIDSLITDPPAGIAFMNKEWDKDKGGRDSWIAWMTGIMSECLRVMKPGAHGLVWALPRTSHWTATALENAGFEVRDVITHLFGSGFPKSQNIAIAIDKQSGVLEHRGKAFVTAGVGERQDIQNTTGWREDPGHLPVTEGAKQWSGWGTALKPASEHWILIRKPCSEKTVAANVLKWNCGGINIDGCRVGTTEVKHATSEGGKFAMWNADGDNKGFIRHNGNGTSNPQGRFPANLILDEEAAEMLDEQSGVLSLKGSISNYGPGDSIFGIGQASTIYKDKGGASRFFFCYKPDVEHAKKSECKTITAPFAGNNFEITQVIEQIESIFSVQENVTRFTDLVNRFLVAKYAEINAENIVIDFVQEVAKTLSKSDLHSLQCLVYILEHKKQTHILSLALTAVLLENIVITPTIQNLQLLNGFAYHVTDAIISLVNQESAVSLDHAPIRFRYQAKASKREKNEGLEGMPLQDVSTCTGATRPNQPARLGADPHKKNEQMQNHHPCVKALKLMEYLITLITPPGGTVLDCFMGSGSTLVAAKRLGFNFIGIEKEAEYFEIAEKRIS